MAAIEIKGVHHHYRYHFWDRRKTALNGLDLQVETGEIFGYLGANGAGKTTTIKILVGLLRCTAGSARILGQSVDRTCARRELGFQPENPYFYEYLTARETLRFYGALSDVPRERRNLRSEELLEFVGLREAAEVRVRDFSKGMRQRLGIAQALIHQPRLVIFDEPMSGLDPVGRSQVREIIVGLRNQGLTVFFSSHVLADVELICDRVGLLAGGRLQACGRLDELLGSAQQRIEVGVLDLPAAAAAELEREAIRTRSEGELRLFAYPDWAAADRAVEAVRRSGGRLRLVRPGRESLEEYFMRTTGRSRAEVGAWSGGGDK